MLYPTYLRRSDPFALMRWSCPNAWCRSAKDGSPERGWSACQGAAGGRLTVSVSLNGASVSRLM